mmetsp:Transcript_100548/g.288069  ORF Transcript_100548/g.288069 Transcript_100548/m.288069 type:complete len:254 (-) Transcript_100548:293-1054(-)
MAVAASSVAFTRAAADAAVDERDEEGGVAGRPGTTRLTRRALSSPASSALKPPSVLSSSPASISSDAGAATSSRMQKRSARRGSPASSSVGTSRTKERLVLLSSLLSWSLSLLFLRLRLRPRPRPPSSSASSGSSPSEFCRMDVVALSSSSTASRVGYSRRRPRAAPRRSSVLSIEVIVSRSRRSARSLQRSGDNEPTRRRAAAARRASRAATQRGRRLISEKSTSSSPKVSSSASCKRPPSWAPPVPSSVPR